MRDRRPHPIDIPGFRTLGTVFKVVLLLALAAFGVFALFSVCTILAAVNMERDWKVEEMNAARAPLPPHRERIASTSPQWTPDGSRIALGHMGDIYVVNPDDAASLHPVHGGGGELDVHHSPKISPDGSRMAYMKYEHSHWVFFTRHNWEAATSMLDGADERNIDGETPDRDSDRLWNQRDHAWSPDGSRLALSLGGTVYLIDADGSNMRWVLYDRKIRGYAGDDSLRWSPDGSRLSFVIKISKAPELEARHPESVVYAIGADGSNLTRIYQGEHISSPTWSPDGSRIAFVEATRIDGGNSALYSTHAVSPDGGVLTTIHETVDVFDGYIAMKEVSWSSDGTKLLVSVANSARVINSDGSGSRTLVSLRPAHPPRNLSASWSPDGSKIAVYNGGGHEGALFTMSPDGSDKRVLALNGNPLRPAQNQAWDPAYDVPTATPSPTPAPSATPNPATPAPASAPTPASGSGPAKPAPTPLARTGGGKPLGERAWRGGRFPFPHRVLRNGGRHF